jgi:hypothetical protein
VPASDPSYRRRVPVRLVDVPLDLRLKAAREECRRAKTPGERDALMRAAVEPQSTTFYVTDVKPLSDAA